MITDQKKNEIDEVIENIDQVSDLLVARWEKVNADPREDTAREFSVTCSYMRRVACTLERLSDELLQELKKK